MRRNRSITKRNRPSARRKAAPAKRPGRPALYPEIGTTGLKRSAGYVQEEFQRDLRGSRGMKTFREMRDNSATIGACLGAVEMLIRQVTWYAKPYSDDSEDLRRAAFLEECRTDMSSTWEEHLAEFLTMLPFGFAYHELVYKKRMGDGNDPTRRSKYSDGLVGWRKIPLRGQDTLLDWKFDDAGGLQAMRQQAAPDWKVREIPIGKALHFRAKSEKNNPEGRSILRNAYFPWYFAKRIQEIEGIGIERDLAGLPVAYVPAEALSPTASDDQKAMVAAVEELVRNIRRDEQEGVVFPAAYDAGGHALYKLELLTTGGRRQFDTSVILDRYERQMAMTIFQDLILMGQPNTVQYKGKNMPQMFAVALEGWVDAIAGVFNQHAIPRLWRLNGWDPATCAQLKHGEAQAPDLAALGDYISKLSGAGIKFTDRPTQVHVRRVADLPDPPQELEPEPGDPQPAPPILPGGDDPPNPGGPDDQGGNGQEAVLQAIGLMKAVVPVLLKSDHRAALQGSLGAVSKGLEGVEVAVTRVGDLVEALRDQQARIDVHVPPAAVEVHLGEVVAAQARLAELAELVKAAPATPAVDLSEVKTGLDGIARQLAGVTAALLAPVVKELERDGKGRPTRVHERRKGKV